MAKTRLAWAVPSTVWGALDRIAVFVGALGVAFIAADGVLATEHAPKGFLLAWGVGLAVFATILGIVGIVGKIVSERQTEKADQGATVDSAEHKQEAAIWRGVRSRC